MFIVAAESQEAATLCTHKRGPLEGLRVMCAISPAGASKIADFNLLDAASINIASSGIGYYDLKDPETKVAVDLHVNMCIGSIGALDHDKASLLLVPGQFGDSIGLYNASASSSKAALSDAELLVKHGMATGYGVMKARRDMRRTKGFLGLPVAVRMDVELEDRVARLMLMHYEAERLNVLVRIDGALVYSGQVHFLAKPHVVRDDGASYFGYAVFELPPAGCAQSDMYTDPALGRLIGYMPVSVDEVGYLKYKIAQGYDTTMDGEALMAAALREVAAVEYAIATAEV